MKLIHFKHRNGIGRYLNIISGLQVWLGNLASVNKVEDSSKKIPNINMQPPGESTHLCSPHTHTN